MDTGWVSTDDEVRSREASPSLVDFRRSLPPRAPSLHPRLAAAMDEIRADLDFAELLHAARPRGTEADRLAGAQFLASRLGLGVDPDRIAPVNGTQSALLLLLPHLVGRGGVLLAEQLSYGALREVARAAGVRLVGVEIDDEGVLPDAFERACRDLGKAALYCNPTVQNPTTAVMSAARRLEIAAIARRHGVPIIEDDALGRLHLDAAAPFARLAPDVTWYVMSASKALSHGFRLAYVVAPSREARDGAIDATPQLSFWTASPLIAALAGKLIARGDADLISSEIAAETLARERFASATLAPFGARSQPGAMHLWLPLPGQASGLEFAELAARHGVLLRPAEMFAVDAAPAPKAVRLSLSTPVTADAVRDGVTRVRRLLEGLVT